MELRAIEPWIRLGSFVGVMGAMALWEAAAPWRARTLPRRRRWPGNLGLAVAGALAVRVALPIAPVAVAIAAEARHLGVLRVDALPEALRWIVTLLVLDAVIYGQHVLFHRVGVLWRLHRVHHADLELDVTSGVRFHPIEIVLSLMLKSAVVLGLGAPPGAVVAFEVILNGITMFNHANVTLGPRWERVVRALIVTPGMHRVHHSIDPAETSSNFAFNLALWDRLFRTYREEPRRGADGVVIGLEALRTPEATTPLHELLLLPFRRDSS